MGRSGNNCSSGIIAIGKDSMKKIFLLLLFITSCSVTSPNVSIMDNPKCDLPCWNNIIPGETTQPDTLQIISGLDGLNQGKTVVINQPWKIFNKRIWFYLYTDPSLAKVQTDGAVYFIDDKVVALSLQRNIGRTFGEMMELTGEPESIVSMPFADGGTVVMAIIPTKGIIHLNLSCLTGTFAA